MEDIGKGLASLGVCVVAGMAFYLGHPGQAVLALAVGFYFVWC